MNRSITRGIVFAGALLLPGGAAIAAQQAEANSDEPAAATVPAKKTPAQAATDIRAALQASPDIAHGRISVNVHANAVVLAGDVDTESQAASALALAQQRAGGVRVASYVEVSDKVSASEAGAAQDP